MCLGLAKTSPSEVTQTDRRTGGTMTTDNTRHGGSAASRSVVLRCVVAALLVAMSGLLAAPSTEAAAPGQECTRGDAQAVAEAGPHFAKAFFEGSPSAAAETWARCQFRLYDDNDPLEDPDNPEIPHVFTVNDFFLAGIFYFEGIDPGQHRADAIASLDVAASRFYFGPSTTPDADLPQVPLTRTGYRDAVLPLFDGHNIWVHDYAIFEPGELAPGEYRWRAEVGFPGDISVYFGAVTILVG
jgi:hypothetical protein